MSGRADTSRDLRVGLYALEAGAIDEAQLVSAVRAWARGSGRSIAEILVSRGALDRGTVAQLEERATRDREATTVQPDRSGGLDGARRAEVDGAEPDATVAYVGRSQNEPAVEFRSTPARYHVLGPRARGGLGEVFLAFDSELNRSVALKELQSRRAHDPDAQARFLLEAEVTGRLEHPGIVPVYSLGRHPDGRPFYAMRLIEGETLGVAIDRLHQTGAGALKGDDRELTFRRLLRSVVDVCNAVAYAHSRGVVHRDLKPDNIMLGPFGETLVVDWGVAKAFQEQGPNPRSGQGLEPGAGAPAALDLSMTQPGAVIGTPRYMSPEQAAGDLDRVGPASDIYSLGAILYCLLVGHAPFPERTLATVLDRVRRGIFPAPRRVRRSVDPVLEAICLKAMALDPLGRYPTALEMAVALEAWQADVRYRGEQEQALTQVKGSLTRLCLERAHQGFGRDAHAEGMLWLARALENAPVDPPELQRQIRTSLSGWHAGARLMERTFRHTSSVLAFAFCPAGRRLATACADRTARLWDVSTGAPLSRPLEHDGPVRAVAFRTQGKTLATAGDDGTVRFWDDVSGDPVEPPLQHDGPIAGLCFSPDGATLAVSGEAAGIVLWDLAARRPIVMTRRDADSKAPTTMAAFSPTGAFLAVADHAGAVELVDLATGRPVGEPLRHQAGVSRLVFDSTGLWLLTTDLDGDARIWELATGAAVVTLAHPGAIQAVGFRPEGGAFATASDDGTARLWETRTGRPIGEPLAHRARVACLAFRSDGTMLATGSADGTIRLWCATTGLPIGPPLAQGGAVLRLAFSPDGRRLAAGGSDATVRCWKSPDPVEGDPERISCWVGATTDLEFDSGDAIRRMDGPTSWECRRRLTELGGPPLR